MSSNSIKLVLKDTASQVIADRLAEKVKTTSRPLYERTVTTASKVSRYTLFCVGYGVVGAVSGSVTGTVVAFFVSGPTGPIAMATAAKIGAVLGATLGVYKGWKDATVKGDLDYQKWRDQQTKVTLRDFEDLIINTAMLANYDLECSISHEIMENPVMTACGHTFDLNQITQWTNQGGTCPMCRAEITEPLKPNYRAIKRLAQVNRMLLSGVQQTFHFDDNIREGLRLNLASLEGTLKDCFFQEKSHYDKQLEDGAILPEEYARCIQILQSDMTAPDITIMTKSQSDVSSSSQASQSTSQASSSSSSMFGGIASLFSSSTSSVKTPLKAQTSASSSSTTSEAKRM